MHILMFALYLLSGLLMAGLGLPMLLRMVSPNPLYGFRTARTLADPDLWYEANAYAGKLLLGSGLVVTIVAVGLYLLTDLAWDSYTVLCGAVLILAIVVTVVLSLRYLRQWDAPEGN